MYIFDETKHKINHKHNFSTFKIINSELNFSGSLYISKLDSAESKQEEFSIPWEYGINSYIGYRKTSWPLEIYGGLDYERFSSFNTEEVAIGEALSTREHGLTYLTLGMAKKFGWLNKNFLFKASYSQSILSSQSRESLRIPRVPKLATRRVRCVYTRGLSSFNIRSRFYSKEKISCLASRKNAFFCSQ